MQRLEIRRNNSATLLSHSKVNNPKSNILNGAAVLSIFKKQTTAKIRIKTMEVHHPEQSEHKAKGTAAFKIEMMNGALKSAA